MGRANAKEKGMSCSYIVGRYKEAGNMGGEYKKNVLKGKFTKDLCDKLDDVIKDIPSDKSTSSVKFSSDSDKVKYYSGSEGIIGVNVATSEDASSTESPFDKNGLKAHNKFRTIHGAADMKIDDTLSKDAESYAKKLAESGKLKHAELEDIGENLAYGCSSNDSYELTAAEAVRRW